MGKKIDPSTGLKDLNQKHNPQNEDTSTDEGIFEAEGGQSMSSKAPSNQSQPSSEEGIFSSSVESYSPKAPASLQRDTDVFDFDVNEYSDYVENTFIPVSGEEGLRKQQAAQQSGFEATRNALGRVVPKMILGIGEQAGYLLDFESHVKTITGEGTDYSNFLTQMAQNGRAALDDWAPIYRENPNETFDLGDPAWWISHGEGLVDSIGQFAIVGMGVGGMFSKAATGLAKMMSGVAKTEMVLGGIAQGATAMTLAYAEGAMTGGEVYKTMYQKALKNGKTAEEANKIAAQAAATTVQLNTVINTALNATSTKGFMRPYSKSKQMDLKHGRRKGADGKYSESIPDWRKRLKQDPELKRSKFEIAKTLGIEAVQESAEEVVNEIASNIGEYEGEELMGLLEENDKKQGWTGRVFETLAQDETWLAAILGAVGGVGQTLVTSNTKNAREQREQEVAYEQSQIGHLVDKIDDFEAAYKKMETAKESGNENDYDNAMFELFGIQAFDSFVTGTQDQVKSMYEAMYNMSPEEAAKQGFETDPKNKHYYKDRAQEAMADIDHLYKEYEDTIHKHNAYDDDATANFYGQRVFHRKLLGYNLEKGIGVLGGDIQKAEAKLADYIEKRGFGKYSYGELWEAQQTVDKDNILYDKIQQDLKALKSMDGRKGKRHLVEAYGRAPAGVSQKQHAIDVLNKRAAKVKARHERNTTRYKNAKKRFQKTGSDIGDGTFDIDSRREDTSNFDAQLLEASNQQMELARLKATKENLQESLIESDKSLADLQSEEGKKDFIKKAKAESKKKTKKKENNAKKSNNKKKVEDQEKSDNEAKKKTTETEQKEGEAPTKREGKPAPVPGGDTSANKEGETVSTEQTVQAEGGVDSQEEQAPEVDATEESEEEAINKAIKEGLDKPPAKEFEDGDTQKPTKDVKKDSYEQKEGLSTSNFLVIPAGNTFAYKSKDYAVNEQTGKKETVTSEKSKDLHKPLESSVQFMPGTEITMMVDEEAEWTETDANGNEVVRSYKDYTDYQGTITDIANVPIKIVDAEGNTIAYVRENSWITEVYAGQYSNVANENDPESPLYRNAERQALANMQIRKHIVKNGATKTKINSKGDGFLSLNLENGKKTVRPMYKNTPGIKTITVVKNGQFHISKSEVRDSEKGLMNTESFIKNLDQANGMVYVPIPSPSGRELMVPVSIPKLTKSQSGAIMNALEMHYANNNQGASEVEGEIGLNLLSPENMMVLMQSMTHVVQDSEASFQERVDNSTLSSWHISFSSDSKHAKAGKTILRFAQGERGVVTIKSLADFNANREALENAFSQKLFSVHLDRINKSSEVSEVTLNEEGKIVAVPHENYNEYVKQYLGIDVLGTKINDDEYSYFDQPVIGFDAGFTGQPPIDIEEAKKKPYVPTEQEDINDANAADERIEEEFDAELAALEGETTQDSSPFDQVKISELGQTKRTDKLIAMAMVESLDEDGHPCTPIAKDGARPGAFTRNSEWEIVKDLKGYPSHAKGGVDLNISSKGVTFKNNKGQDIMAKNGLIITSRK